MKYQALVNETEKAVQQALDPQQGKQQMIFVERVGPDAWKHKGNTFKGETIEEAMGELPPNATVFLMDCTEFEEAPLTSGKNDLNTTEDRIPVTDYTPPVDLQPLPEEEETFEQKAEETFDENWMRR